MPLVDLPAPLQWPSMVGFNYLGLTLDNATLNAAGYYVGGVFEIPKTGEISSVSVKIGSVVNTAGTLEIRLETVDPTTGQPTGTLYHANATVNVSVNTVNTWVTGTFASDVPVTFRDTVAIVFKWVAGDFTIYVPDRMFTWTVDFPYAFANVGAGFSKLAVFPNFHIKYDDGSVPYIPGVWGMENRVTTSYQIASVPDEVAAEFSLPFGGRVTHMWAFVDADGPATYRLYNQAGTVLGSTTKPVNGLRRRDSGSPEIFLLDAPVTLAAGSTYRASVLATSGTNIGIQSVVAASLSGTPMGTGWKFVSRTDGDVWIETTGRSPLIGLIFDQIDVGAVSAGGSFFHPSMQGGMNA